MKQFRRGLASIAIVGLLTFSASPGAHAASSQEASWQIKEDIIQIIKDIFSIGSHHSYDHGGKGAPGPIAGAGLPFAIAGAAAFVRRRRNKARVVAEQA